MNELGTVVLATADENAKDAQDAGSAQKRDSAELEPEIKERARGRDIMKRIDVCERQKARGVNTV